MRSARPRAVTPIRKAPPHGSASISARAKHRRRSSCLDARDHGEVGGVARVNEPSVPLYPVVGRLAILSIASSTARSVTGSRKKSHPIRRASCSASAAADMTITGIAESELLFGTKCWPVHERHHEVEDDHIGPYATRNLIESLLPIRCRRDLEALVAERFRINTAQVVVVIHDHHAERARVAGR
jgi:hypothetical protein